MPNDPNSDFVAQPHLTAIAENYRNPDKALIADSVLPRVPVSQMQFTYQKAKDPLQAFRLPETRVGPRGKPNQLEMGMTETPEVTVDNAIDVPLGAEDMKRDAKAKEHATELGASIIQLRHEVEVANLVFDGAQYPAGFKETVAGTDQFDSGAYAGDALELIQDGLDAMLLPANVLCFARDVWSKFRKLPEVVSAILGNAGDKGLVKPEQVANLFGVQEVVVGEAFIVTSKPGEATALSRAWSKKIAAIHRDRTANTTAGVTFGFTAEYDKIKSGEIPDKDAGARGGTRIRTYQSTKPVIVAGMAGYLWEDAIS